MLQKSVAGTEMQGIKYALYTIIQGICQTLTSECLSVNHSNFYIPRTAVTQMFCLSVLPQLVEYLAN